MHIDEIQNGIVLDHITAGKAMEIYHFLELDGRDCPVAILQNVGSRKMGRKDIIKIDAPIDTDLNVLAVLCPGITVNVIRDGVRVEKKALTLPPEVKDVIKCKNPRCITTTEQELSHVFVLTDVEARVYRCLYCEAKADGNE